MPKKKVPQRKWRTDNEPRVKVTLSISDEVVADAKSRKANLSKEAEQALRAKNKAYKGR